MSSVYNLPQCISTHMYNYCFSAASGRALAPEVAIRLHTYTCNICGAYCILCTDCNGCIINSLSMRNQKDYCMVTLVASVYVTEWGEVVCRVGVCTMCLLHGLCLFPGFLWAKFYDFYRLFNISE